MVKEASRPAHRRKPVGRKIGLTATTTEGQEGSSSGETQQTLGSRVRFLRSRADMTLDQLAARSRLTKSFVSKIERGLSVPSISTAMKLSESFGLTVGQLLGEEQYEDAVCVVRKGQRRRFMRAGSSSGYNYEMIAAGKRFKTMEPFVMYPPTEFQHNRMFQHPGQELIFVLSGTVEVQFADRTVLLNKDDSVYFDAHVPHRSRSVGKAPAQALVVVTLDRAQQEPAA